MTRIREITNKYDVLLLCNDPNSKLVLLPLGGLVIITSDSTAEKEGCAVEFDDPAVPEEEMDLEYLPAGTLSVIN